MSEEILREEKGGVGHTSKSELASNLISHI